MVAVLGGIVTLVVVAATWSTSRIQDDLTARSRTALADFGIPDTVTVRYQGLDAVLTGTVTHPQQAADAIGAVAGVAGTRHVTSLVTMAGASRPAATPFPGPTPTAPDADTPGSTPTPGSTSGALHLPPGKITFATGDAVLPAEAQAHLDQVAAFLVARPEIRLEVRGHSDTSGTDEINWALSKQRAAAVVDYLVTRQVPADRLHPTAFAATVPLASNDTPDGRAANRRVELAIEESP
jgi:outer membrane protein OmpA-like peptidoglycan-associated protein